MIWIYRKAGSDIEAGKNAGTKTLRVGAGSVTLVNSLTQLF